MSLSSLLANSATSSTGDDQGRWRQFILDHLDYIARRSKTYTISPTLMYRYQYDLQRFLSDNQDLSRKEDMAWIVQLLNDWPNDFYFDQVTQCVIPSDNLILELYHSYITINNNSF